MANIINFRFRSKRGINIIPAFGLTNEANVERTPNQKDWCLILLMEIR